MRPNRLTTTTAALAIGIMTAGAAGLAAAQPVPPAGPAEGMHFRHHRPSAAVMQHLADGRVAFIAAALELTPEQKPLWDPVAKVLHEQADSFAAHRAERGPDAAKQADGKEGPAAKEGRRWHHEGMKDRDADAIVSGMADRMARRAEEMNERAGEMKKLADALKPLVAKLTDEQKETLKIALMVTSPRPPMHPMPHHGRPPFAPPAPGR